MSKRNFENQTFEPPLPPGLFEELIAFWEQVFGTSYRDFRGILTAEEKDCNHDTIQVCRKGNRLSGTSHLTISKGNPALGGLGEVATVREFRRRGVAESLCARARDAFEENGGKALFLGTVNTLAARIYARLGWQELPGTTVMVCVTDGGSAEAFLSSYFGTPGKVTVSSGTAADRIPMIPLIVTPHPWKILDANVNLFSTSCSVQNSCMGLYPRYQALARQTNAAWFAAHTLQGLLVGLSTSIIDDRGYCRVDGFTHPNHQNAWKDVMAAAIGWAGTQRARLCRVTVLVDDVVKGQRFQSLGFHETGSGDALGPDERCVPTLELQKAISEF